MVLSDKIIYLSGTGIVKKAVEKVLSDKIDNEGIQELSNNIWREFKERSKKIEKKETFGATVMVKLSLLTLIIYELIFAKNIDKKVAINQTSKILWIIYEHLTHKFWIFTRLFSRRPIRRVRKAMQFFINYFPYKNPGYKMKLLETNDNVVAFNVTKCPASAFFKEHNLGELCIESWCNLDYPLAKKWNVKLERDKTIAKGNELCNFKFIE